jgi:hypothetical protein
MADLTGFKVRTGQALPDLANLLGPIYGIGQHVGCRRAARVRRISGDTGDVD